MTSVKRLLPKGFKQFLWFLFKSPQRKWHELGYQTILTDFNAWLSTRSNPKTLNPVTICIGIKNRSVNLLDHVIGSMNACDNKHLLKLSIHDAGSDDIDDLEASVKARWKGYLIYNKTLMPFSRSATFNLAVKQADEGLILVCDADMSLPKDIVFKVNKFVNSKSAWFPHVWYQNEDGKTGRYYTESTGMMACRKSDYLKTGGMDESIKEWGKEDWLLFFEFYKHGIGCIRSNEPEFIHHYHPSLKPENFKPLF